MPTPQSTDGSPVNGVVRYKLYNNSGDIHCICLSPLGSFKDILVAYLDAKAILRESLTISRTPRSHDLRSRVRCALYSFVSSLTISVSFRASVLSFRFCFILVSCPFVPCNG